MTSPKSPVSKQPCQYGGHKAKVSATTGLVLSHRCKGKHCLGSGKDPAPRREGQ